MAPTSKPLNMTLILVILTMVFYTAPQWLMIIGMCLDITWGSFTSMIVWMWDGIVSGIVSIF